MADIFEFFLNSSPTNVRLDTLSISHPNISREYNLVANKTDGLTATLETGASQDFEYAPFGLEDSRLSSNLDYGLQIRWGDLGEILPDEIENIKAAGGMGIAPQVIYRSFASNDLSSPMEGPLLLEMRDPTSDSRGTSFLAAPRNANDAGTGEIYSLTRFPMLRGAI